MGSVSEQILSAASCMALTQLMIGWGSILLSARSARIASRYSSMVCKSVATDSAALTNAPCTNSASSACSAHSRSRSAGDPTSGEAKFSRALLAASWIKSPCWRTIRCISRFSSGSCTGMAPNYFKMASSPAQGSVDQNWEHRQRHRDGTVQVRVSWPRGARPIPGLSCRYQSKFRRARTLIPPDFLRRLVASK